MRPPVKKYIAVWMKLAQMGFLTQFATRWGSLGWLGGKCVRLVFFFVFLTAIFKHVPSVAGYSIWQVAFFFLTFNLIDIAAQLFFRGIYMIGRDVREGDMDFYLVQPVNALFRIASNLIDFLDFLTLIPVVILLAAVFPKVVVVSADPEFFYRLFLYGVLCLNGVVIAFSIHVVIAALTVMTQQMENTIWLYRDLISLGRFPIDIYSSSIRFFLSTFLPVAVMISYPAKALMGILAPENLAFAFVLSGGLLALALGLWRAALRSYCSVSS